jgi:hypothetical protein
VPSKAIISAPPAPGIHILKKGCDAHRRIIQIAFNNADNRDRDQRTRSTQILNAFNAQATAPACSAASAIAATISGLSSGLPGPADRRQLTRRCGYLLTVFNQ